MSYERVDRGPGAAPGVRALSPPRPVVPWGPPAPEPPRVQAVPIFHAPTDERRVLRAPATPDFAFDGEPDAPPWRQARAMTLEPLDDGRSALATSMKALWSPRGVYLRFDATDDRLTTTMKDGEDLWLGDALEIMLCPQVARSTYLQYILSPLGAELVLMVPNMQGVHMGWLPWRYEGSRRIRSHVAVRGGRREPFAEVTGWTAEIFVPFELMCGLIDAAPLPGTMWRANFHRVDYRPDGSAARWAFDAAARDPHDCASYGVLQFC